jgi:CBS domain containing-hemolysin-like protein
MENRKLLLGLCMLICGLAIVLLATGSPILLYPLGGEDGLPIGNLITWFGFIAFPTSFYLGIAKIRASKGWKRVFEILILFAILWWPISYFLSGI